MGPWKKRACRGPATITRLPSLFINQLFHNIRLLQPYDVCPSPARAFLRPWLLYLRTMKVLQLLKLPYYQRCARRECCHCLCLQETHRSTNLPRLKIAGMSLVIERPHIKYGSAILIRNDLKVKKIYERVQGNCGTHYDLWCLELLYTLCTSRQTTRLNSQLWATETYHILWLKISTATVLRGATQTQITKEKR